MAWGPLAHRVSLTPARLVFRRFFAFRRDLVHRGYEHELQGADILLRYLPRRTGAFPLQYARILATHPANAAGGWNTAWTGNVVQQYDQLGQVATLAECRKLLAVLIAV